MSDLPNVFIASSAEGLNVAEAVNIKLEHDARVTPWDNTFPLSSITIMSLIKTANEMDYGIFIFHKDDKAEIRGDTYSVVRDNVLIELGLFIGVLGIEKCFILIPKSAKEEFRLPSDLAGVTTSTYDDQRDNMVDAVTPSCGKIKILINSQKTQAVTIQEQNTPSVTDVLQTQLNSIQSQLWSLGNELQRSKEDIEKLLQSIKSHFLSIAKPATDTEITAWENGAKDNYNNEIKISRHNVYFVDKDTIIPPFYGANSISLIIAKGVRVYGTDKWSHNSIYYMDGFRKDGIA